MVLIVSSFTATIQESPSRILPAQNAMRMKGIYNIEFTRTYRSLCLLVSGEYNDEPGIVERRSNYEYRQNRQ